MNEFQIISSIFYVFYEQYLTIWEDSAFSLGISLATVITASFILTGLDFVAAFVIFLMVMSILINMCGMMWLWNISLNAISLVNLVVVSGNLIHNYLDNIFLTLKNTFCSLLESALSLCHTSFERFAKPLVHLKSELVKHSLKWAVVFYQE